MPCRLPGMGGTTQRGLSSVNGLTLLPVAAPITGLTAETETCKESSSHTWTSTVSQERVHFIISAALFLRFSHSILISFSSTFQYSTTTPNISRLNTSSAARSLYRKPRRERVGQEWRCWISKRNQEYAVSHLMVMLHFFIYQTNAQKSLT